MTEPRNSPPRPPPAAAESGHNFEFAFNSINFSDRILDIEITADPPSAGCEKRRLTTATDAEPPFPPKRRRSTDAECLSPPQRLEDKGDKSSESNDSSWSMDYSHVQRIRSVYINSAILAAKSPFFFKLFTNGMVESNRRQATLRINASEEAALMELLEFMYSGKLSTTSPSFLLDVMMAADKYDVVCCTRHCNEVLRSLPMNTESALFYLDLPSSVSMTAAVQPLTNAAKEFLVNKFRDINKFQDEALSLPLVVIEAVLSSNDLQVGSEDDIYDFVIKWARSRYANMEERHEILRSCLLCLIRFPHLSWSKLTELIRSNDLDDKLSLKLVADAISFKSSSPQHQRILASGESTCRMYGTRNYKYKPVKTVEFDRPNHQCIVYLELTQEECAKRLPLSMTNFHTFQLLGHYFYISGRRCSTGQESSNCYLGLYLLGKHVSGPTLLVDYEFFARTRASGEFVSKHKASCTFKEGKPQMVGPINLFNCPLTTLMSESSPYFINGILYLRAELTIKEPPLPNP